MKDYSRDRDFVRRFRDGALEIARRKMADVAAHQADHPTVVPLGPRLSTGGHFGGFFLWDTVFCALWARHAQDAGDFPLLSPLDNLYALAEPDGFIAREYNARGVPVWSSLHPVAFAPPLLSWAEVVMHREGRSPAGRLESVYPRLVRHHRACQARFRRPDGLYFGDGFGCGMDDIPRHPRGMSAAAAASLPPGGIRMTEDCLGPESKGIWEWLFKLADHLSWNRQAGWIDMTCQMAFDALNLARIAAALGRSDDERAFLAEHQEIADAVNALCWDDAVGFYCDAGPDGVIRRQSAAGFWALISRVARPERARRVIDALKDPARFNRPFPFPAVPADDPEDYQPETAYWRGVVWPPTTYVALHGLLEWGERDFAEDAARRYYNANAALFESTGTVWENISPEQCEHPKEMSGRDFCGWGALAPVALPAEFGWL